MSYRQVALFVVCSASFLSVLDLFIVNVALPSIKEGIHGTNGDSQMIMALYLLGHAIFLVTGGRMGDYYGHKKIFIWSMLLFTLASGCCAAAANATQLNISRFFQGAFAAFMVPQSIAFIQLLFPEQKERSKALSTYGAIGGIASVAGQALGGILPEIANWRWLFIVNLPIGLLAAIIAYYWLKEPTPTIKGKPDHIGILLLSTGLMTLIYPLIRGRETGWPLWSILSIAVSFLLLIIFIFSQQKKDGLIDLNLFRNKEFNIGLAAVVAYFIVQDSYFFINTMMLQSGMGLTTGRTGFYFVAQGIGFVVAALYAIKLVAVYGKRVLQAGVLLMIVMLLMHILFIKEKRYLLTGILFLYGVGCGAVLPSLLTLALSKIPLSLAGTAAGTYVTFQQISIALGVCITGGLFLQLLGDVPLWQQWVQAYRCATGVNIFFLLLVCYLLYKLP
ncbi:MFS transporter [Chitinophaga sp.]|uniref:MFS transporter n=1 Tax=Chitinophaga sp. TaxID=1869181 RepID=UPI0031D8AC48